jgi:hypothetical protein
MADFSRLEKIGEIARLMKLPPGRFAHMKVGDTPGVNAPIPRYPGWMYLCPKCHELWTQDAYHEAWLKICPKCRKENE